jgi:predicted TIM-barrel fold metal-dependent hydrolase
MKIVALEEHFATAEIITAWQSVEPELRDLAVEMSTGNDKQALLLDLADQRILRMDQAGIDVQVLSVTTPGVQSLEPSRAVPLARAANDRMAETIRFRPDRFQGFATLPTSSPEDAARELERAVVELGLNGAMLFGRTGERNLDHPEFLPILEVAAGLRAPIYLHPQSPLPPVRRSYYDGFDHALNTAFATAGIGWHYETGVQALRLVLSGVFERLPELHLILGHWGEVVLFYLDRIDMVSAPARLPRKVSEYFATNVSVTPSGIFSQRYLRWAIETLGIDRVLLATDYPFVLFNDGAARRFLQNADLSDIDRDKIAFGNWARLCADIRRG